MNLIESEALYNQIAADCNEAFGTPLIIDYGKPRTEPNVIQVVVIALDGVTSEWDGTETLEQTYSFTILYRSPIITGDADFNIELAKAQKANALMELLQADRVYAEIGNLPLVTDVKFSESDDLEKQYYMVQITFQVTVYQEY